MNFRLIIVVIVLFAFNGAARLTQGDTCIQRALKVSHITGHVVALWQRREEPVSKATIELREFRDDEWKTKFTTTSDDQGFFQIPNVPSGKYEIHVARDNFHSFGTTLHLKASKLSATREIVVILGIDFHNCGSGEVRKLNR